MSFKFFQIIRGWAGVLRGGKRNIRSGATAETVSTECERSHTEPSFTGSILSTRSKQSPLRERTTPEIRAQRPRLRNERIVIASRRKSSAGNHVSNRPVSTKGPVAPKRVTRQIVWLDKRPRWKAPQEIPGKFAHCTHDRDKTVIPNVIDVPSKTSDVSALIFSNIETIYGPESAAPVRATEAA